MILKGYIFARPFLGERVPQHIQNIVNQDYCKKKEINLLMSGTEHAFPKSTYILFEILESINSYDGILFYSLLQLPEDKILRDKLYKKILSKKKQIHFSVENLILKTKNDQKYIENIYKLYLVNSSENFKLGKEQFYVNYRHKNTKRNCLERMNDDKIFCMKVAKKYGKDYWDGYRRYGYGGYKYIRDYHKYLAINLIRLYKLTPESKILDVGCGKGYLVYEISKLLNSSNVYGCDISKYAIKNSKKEIKKNIFLHDARKKFIFNDKHFDFVFSNTTLHNFKLPDLYYSLKEIERIASKKYICVESYRNEKEQFNLQCWALTAETIIDKKSWLWLFNQVRYTGDYEFIYF